MKKAKVILINPPLSAAEQSGGGSLEIVANILPPLGMAYLGAVLEKDNFDVKLIDSPVLNLTCSSLMDILKKENPDITGITSTTLSFKSAVNVAESIKKLWKDKIVIIGGPETTAEPREVMKNECFDIGVYGEGEMTLLELCNELCEKGREWKADDLKKIKGVLLRVGGKIVFTGLRQYIQNLDELPFPAMHLLPPPEKYSPTPATYKKLPLVPIITSRGCPNQCTFCDRSVFGNVFRVHSAKRVVDEIEHLVNKYGVKEIRFWDDTLTINKKRVMEICRLLKERKLDIAWTCFTRVNVVDEELLNAMKDAGCWQVSYGLESGSQKILDSMKKGITVEQSRNAVMLTKKAGLNMRAFFVMGTPDETQETLEETINFAKSLPIDVVNFYAMTPYPGSEIYRYAVRNDMLIHKDYNFYHEMIDFKTSKLPFVPKALTEEQLKKAIVRAHKQFYLRPSYIFSQLLSIRSLEDVKRYWRGFRAIVSL